MGAALSVAMQAGTLKAQIEQPVQQQAAYPPARVRVRVPESLQAKLHQAGFAVSDDNRSPRLAQLYRRWSRQDYPVIVTTDAALHTSHLLFDWYQRFLEIAHLRGDLVNLTDALAVKMMAYHDESEDAAVKKAALSGACFLLIGKRCLSGGNGDGAPEPWKGKMDSELEFIRQAKAMTRSPLFGYVEDYSQYQPRGHYSRSEEFAGYFRAMMWFGRMSFRLNEKNPEAARAHARRAILLCRALESAKVKGEDALAVWRRIYETTAFFAGRADDLLPTDYISVLGKQGSDFDITEDADVDRFIASAQELSRPRVLGGWAASSETAGGPDWRKSTQGMCLFGQRYQIDSEITQRLVFDSVLDYTGPKDKAPDVFTLANVRGVQLRAFPRGLDVMSVLGFGQAEKLLRVGGDCLYRNYDTQLKTLRKNIATPLMEAKSQQDLAAWRLRAAAELARKPEGRVPRAMSDRQWQLKQLAAALGSWTELRHDTILYTKESYTASQMAFAGMSKGGPVPPPPPPPKGYVEPMPHVYASIRSSAEALLQQLNSLQYPEDEALARHLKRFAENLKTLEDISQKELRGKGLTKEEYKFIEHIGSAFAVPKYGLPHHRDVTDAFRTEMDDLMPIVADVHTDVNTRMVLEEAVGYPMVLYILCPVDGKPTVCIGAVYSYYEFKHPMEDRLTDEKWRQMLRLRRAPKMPEWMGGYVVGKNKGKHQPGG